MNIVQLQNYIGKIATTIPVVQSYYNESVYDCWVRHGVKYGSVSFVVQNLRETEHTSNWECMIYYGDRLNESRTNVSAVQTDAVNVIQSIVSAIKQSDEIMDIQYPVQTIMFEQEFADVLAGAYASVTIITQGQAECGYDGLELPDYPEFTDGKSTLDDYYTKEQINSFDFVTERTLETLGYATKRDLDQRIGDIDEVLQSLLNDPDINRIKVILDRVLYQ